MTIPLLILAISFTAFLLFIINSTLRYTLIPPHLSIRSGREWMKNWGLADDITVSVVNLEISSVSRALTKHTHPGQRHVTSAFPF